VQSTEQTAEQALAMPLAGVHGRSVPFCMVGVQDPGVLRLVITRVPCCFLPLACCIRPALVSLPGVCWAVAAQTSSLVPVFYMVGLWYKIFPRWI